MERSKLTKYAEIVRLNQGKIGFAPGENEGEGPHPLGKISIHFLVLYPEPVARQRANARHAPSTQKAPNLSLAPGQSVGQSLRLYADNYTK
jgi:hypothetical protein